MIIWTGKGFLVAVLVFACSLAANLATNGLSGADVYWETHSWPFGLSMLVAAALSWPLGILLTHQGARTLVDKATGEEVSINGDHSLFFVPARFWWAILGALGFGVLLCDVAF